MNQQPQSSDGCKPVAIGCFIALLILIGAGAGAVYYLKHLWNNAGDIMVEEGAPVAIEGLRRYAAKMELAPEDHKAVSLSLDRLERKVEKGEVSFPQMISIAANLLDGAFFQILLVKEFKTAYIDKSQLPQAQKDEAKATVERFIHGLLKDQLAAEDIDKMMKLISEQEPVISEKNGEIRSHYRIKKTLTDAELLAALEHMQDSVITAGVPEEGYEVDFARQLNLAIQKGLHDPKLEL